MGYYVRIKSSSVEIPRFVQDQVITIWRNINKPEFNHLKRGGSYSNGRQNEWWYSWMDTDYHKNVNDCTDVLEMLGFDYSITDTGAVSVDYYDNKTGQEDLFFVAIAHLITGKIEWVGEDGECFAWEFKDGKMLYANKAVDNPFIPVYTVPQLDNN